MTAYEQLLAASEPTYVRRAALAGLLRLEGDSGEKRILRVLRGSDPALSGGHRAIPGLRSKHASQTFAAELPRLQPQEQVWMIENLARAATPSPCRIAKSLTASDSLFAAPRSAHSAVSATPRPSPCFPRLAGTNDPEERRAIEAALISLGGGTPTDNAILAELKKASATRVYL